MVKLFFGGFPLEFTELDIAMMVGFHGDIHTIKIVRDKKTRVCKGYAFIEMTTKEGADRAVDALDGTKVGGRLINVKIREDKPVAPARPRFGSDRPKRPRRPM
ncbi:MAG TPA: RNA-binding protein [Mucilaginibacter sp.]|nr:RNA-binding protein [Mucilaginibacter sp.]